MKKRNKKEAAGQTSMVSGWSQPAVADAEALRAAFSALDAAPDGDAQALAAKEAGWQELQDTPAWRRAHFVADVWCAAFVWPKPAGGGRVVEAAPTDAVWRDLRDGRGQASALLVETATEIALRYGLFHWHLAFPTVFGRGGFDVVLGNPPWERVKLQEQEFFAARSPEIAGAVNAAARKRLIAALPEADPTLWLDWCSASREAEGQSHLVRGTGRYPLCGKGDVNTYALFAEHNRSVLGLRGRAGFIVPTGIATDDTTKEYFGALVGEGQLAALYSFENEEFVFPSVHHAFRFALLTVARGGQAAGADLVFFARQARDLEDAERHFSLSSDDFLTVNPNTRTCPTFRSRRDAELNLAMYRRAGVLCLEGSDVSNPWAVKVRTRTWHMAEDSEWFRTRGALEEAGWQMHGNRFELGGSSMIPLVEAKMIHHFDHRFGTYDGQSGGQANQGKLPELDYAAHQSPSILPNPKYWVDKEEASERLRKHWQRRWLLGWRDITGSTVQRTLISAIIPFSATGDTFMLMLPGACARLVSALNANMSSFALDYAARQKVGGLHLKFHVMQQLPTFSPDTYHAQSPWSPGVRIVDWLLPRVLELTYTAWDLEPFGRDVGYDGPPFRWDPARRTLLRAELDAAFFHLYGLNRDDTDYILGTFPIVRKNDEKVHGEYRTKRLILEAYDAMAEAIRTGQPYQTCLDPVPAHPSVAHDPSTRPAWAKAET